MSSSLSFIFKPRRYLLNFTLNPEDNPPSFCVPGNDSLQGPALPHLTSTTLTDFPLVYLWQGQTQPSNSRSLPCQWFEPCLPRPVWTIPDLTKLETSLPDLTLELWRTYAPNSTQRLLKGPPENKLSSGSTCSDLSCPSPHIRGTTSFLPSKGKPFSVWSSNARRSPDERGCPIAIVPSPSCKNPFQ